jgi:hypothetical protein
MSWNHAGSVMQWTVSWGGWMVPGGVRPRQLGPRRQRAFVIVARERPIHRPMHIVLLLTEELRVETK